MTLSKPMEVNVMSAQVQAVTAEVDQTGQPEQEEAEQSERAKKTEEWLRTWLSVSHPETLRLLQAWDISGLTGVVEVVLNVVPRSALECIFDDLVESGGELDEEAAGIIAEIFDTWLYGSQRVIDEYEPMIVEEELPDWLREKVEA